MPRPKGTPKTGGRRAGTPNRVTRAARQRILDDVDPIGFLARVARGEAIETGAVDESGKPVMWVPTPEQRLAANFKLLDKAVPNARDAAPDGDDPDGDGTATPLTHESALKLLK